jgi:hypothetical protein
LPAEVGAGPQTSEKTNCKGALETLIGFGKGS